MMKCINRYSIIYLLQIVLNITFMALLIWYYSTTEVSIQLAVFFPLDLAQFPVIFALFCLLLVFLICDIVFFIKSINQAMKGFVEDSVKKARFIIPIVFVFFAQICFFAPAGMTKTKNNLEKQPFAVSCIGNYNTDFSDRTPYRGDYITCEKNAFGKAGYLEKSISYEHRYIESRLEFLCSYQQCSVKQLEDKFSMYSEETLSLKYKTVGDGYTLFYETGKNENADYSLYIKKDNMVFFSTFSKQNVKDFDYTKEQFVADSLSVFNEWDKF